MTGWLQGIFDLLSKWLQPVLDELRDSVRRVNWFLASVLAAIVGLLQFAVDSFVFAGQSFADFCKALLGKVEGMLSLSSGWSSVSSGAALANCILPMDVVLIVGGVLFVLWCTLQGWRFLVFIYEKIPFKMT